MASADSESWGAGSNLTFTSFGPPGRCKFEHPGKSGSGPGNRFGALSGGGFPGMFLNLLFRRVEASVWS